MSVPTVKQLFITILFTMTLAVANAQQSVVDSLKIELARATTDSAKVQLLANLSFKYVYIAPDTGLFYGKQALQLASKTNDSTGLVIAHNSVGAEYAFLGAYDSASYHFQKVVELGHLLGDELRVAKATNNLGLVAWKKGDFVTAIDKYHQAFDVHERLGDKQGMANNLNNIGLIFNAQQDYDQALEYYQRSLQIKQQLGDLMGSARSLSNIGNIYSNQNQLELALENHMASLRLRQETNDRSGLTASLHNIGIVYFGLGKLDSAESFHKEALIVAKTINSMEDMGAAFDGLANVYLEKGENEKALDYSLKAYQYAKESGYKTLEKNVLATISKSYEVLEKYKNAYLYQEKYYSLKDSLLDEEKVKEIAQLESSYLFQKEKDSIQFEREKDALLYEAELETQHVAQSRLIIGLVFVAILGVLILYFYYNSKKTNTKLQVLNEEVRKQNQLLEKMNQSKTKLFSIVSHDLRGPMSVFQGAPMVMKKLLEKGEEDRLRTWLNDLENYAGQLTALLDNLLSWAINEQGEFPFQLETLDLTAHINETIGYLKGQADHKQLVLEHDLQDECFVVVDKNGLRTILRNLIGNAIKFTPEGGRISISANTLNQHIQLKISDTGVGMSSEQMDKLFGPETSSHAGTGGEKGVGLGLQLVNDFVKKNGGSIQVESEQGKGTTFLVTLPKG